MTNANSSRPTTTSIVGHLKFLVPAIAALTLLSSTGCRTTNVSDKGGVVTLNEQFSITVPAEISLKQGSEVPLNIVLNRGAYFKRDVQLEVKANGVMVTPSSLLVKASDKPEIQLKLAATREAALGDYRVSVTGTPATGKPAAALVIVKVLAQ